MREARFADAERIYREMLKSSPGDPRYPRENPNTARHPLWKERRLALHARSLGLKHPVTGELLSFEAPIPECFAPFLKSRREPARPRR